ncbi:MAG: cyclase family protein [Pyrinomonadaceae bacterium]|nr:cyclase family protein [Pyrinomonadaceae bacterium]
MKINLSIYIFIISFLILGCKSTVEEQPVRESPKFPVGAIVDLSYDFSDQTIYWVNAKRFEKEKVADGMTDAGFYYSANDYSAAEHGGTHIDAPVHFAKDRQTVDQIPLEKLIAPAVKIDVSAKGLSNWDYQISVKDISNWEAVNGPIPDNCIVLFQTGFGKFYPDAEKYLGTANRGDDAAKDLHFPGLHPDAAEWLVKNRKINAVGLDTASVDYGQSKDFKSHITLMNENIPAFENVANLEKLPAKGFQIIALPMKIKGGSGAPLRIVATVPSIEE